MLQEYLNGLSKDIKKFDISQFIDETSYYDDEYVVKDILHVEDLSYFKNIQYLNFNNVGIDSLPSLDMLICLRELHCSYNSLRCLPKLNKNLLLLDCSWNLLESIDLSELGLRNLDCRNNKLSIILSLNESLIEIDCSHNNLTSFTAFPKSLQGANLSHNNLKLLPDFNDSLRFLNVSFNILKTLPQIKYILELNCSNNPIYTLQLIIKNKWLNICSFNTPFHKIIAYDAVRCYYGIHKNTVIGKRLILLNRTRQLCFALKFKTQFIKWMWKSRENTIKEICDPRHLHNFIHDISNEDDEYGEKLDMFLKDFGEYKQLMT